MILQINHIKSCLILTLRYHRLTLKKMKLIQTKTEVAAAVEVESVQGQIKATRKRKNLERIMTLKLKNLE